MNIFEDILKRAKERRENPPKWQPSARTLVSAEAYRRKTNLATYNRFLEQAASQN